MAVTGTGLHGATLSQRKANTINTIAKEAGEMAWPLRALLYNIRIGVQVLAST